MFKEYLENVVINDGYIECLKMERANYITDYMFSKKKYEKFCRFLKDDEKNIIISLLKNDYI